MKAEAFIVPNFLYMAAIILFLIGLHIMFTHPNLIKKIIGMNIIDSAIFFFFVSVGYLEDSHSPVIQEGLHQYVNPLPSALMLTGIVVSVSVTAFALGLVIKIYSFYGTFNIDEIGKIRREETE